MPQDKYYRFVKSTLEERTEWRAKKGPNYSPPHRAECKACGKRFWVSGLSVGSHRRACPGSPPKES